MNRIFPHIQETQPVRATPRNFLNQRALSVEAETRAILRDLAYALSLTRRVKESILEGRELAEANV